jgi:DNA-directed RNA polymerase specialized sigma24 family protein
MTEDLPDSKEAESPPSEIYDEGRTVGEVARHVGVPSGTVTPRAHHALRALRLA